VAELAVEPDADTRATSPSFQGEAVGCDSVSGVGALLASAPRFLGAVCVFRTCPQGMACMSLGVGILARQLSNYDYGPSNVPMART
jgi:hypothetical protein